MIAKLGLAIIMGNRQGNGTPSLSARRRKFESADLFGKGMYEVDELLWKKYPKTAVIGIGQAGEMKLSNAGISVNDPENKPGRYAAWWSRCRDGARGVKAMVVVVQADRVESRIWACSGGRS
jgi:hypothetical protein